MYLCMCVCIYVYVYVYVGEDAARRAPVPGHGGAAQASEGPIVIYYINILNI